MNRCAGSVDEAFNAWRALPRGINADVVELVGAPDDDCWSER